MAPHEKRYCNYYGDCYSYDNYSPWYSYGRWILLAAILVGAFLIFLLFACITARRRRRRGMTPYRGTGWAAHNAAQQQQQQQQYGGAPQPYYGNQQAAPPYTTTPAQGYNYNQTQGYGANQGYFGGQQTGGVELQQPDHAHMRGGDNMYAPPAGPPPDNKA